MTMVGPIALTPESLIKSYKKIKEQRKKEMGHKNIFAQYYKRFQNVVGKFGGTREKLTMSKICDK